MRLIAPATVAALLLPFLVTIPSGGAAPAAECLAAPNAAAPEGSHWSYRTDRVNRRKCWYVAPEDGSVRQTVRRPARPAQPPATSSAPQDAASPAPRAEEKTDGQSASPPQAEAPASPPKAEGPDAWPQMAIDGARPAPDLSLRSIDPWPSADATAHEPVVMSAPAVVEDATTDANADSRDDAAEQAIEDASTKAVTITPTRILIVVLCGLAVFGALLYEIRQLAERRRLAQLDRLHLDRRRVDRGSRAPERVPARTDGLRDPPPWAMPRVGSRADDETTLRRIMRGEERRPGWTDEPAA